MIYWNDATEPGER